MRREPRLPGEDFEGGDRSWMAYGACRHEDTDIFFPAAPRVGRSRYVATVPPEVAAICARCPVAERCLNYALRNRIEHGVWGSTSEAERATMLRELEVA